MRARGSGRAWALLTEPSTLFYASAVIGFLALAAYGASLLQVAVLPAWAGCVTLLIGLRLVLSG